MPGNSPEATAGLTEFDRHAEAAGFVAVYPQGIELSWNAGFCCATAFVQGSTTWASSTGSSKSS